MDAVILESAALGKYTYVKHVSITEFMSVKFAVFLACGVILVSPACKE